MRLNQLFIGKSVKYASSKGNSTKETALTPDTLREGAIGVYGIPLSDATTPANSGKLTLIVGPNASEGTGKIEDANYDNSFIYIASGTPDGYVISDEIPLSDVDKFHGEEYKADTAQVTHIGNVGSGSKSLELPGTIADSDEALISIQFKTVDNPTYTFDINVESGDSASDIADKFVTVINDGQGRQVSTVTAAKVQNSGNYGIQLTGDDPDYPFEVSIDGIIKSAPITYTTNASQGSGDTDHIQRLEKRSQENNGFHNTADPYFRRPDSLVDTGENYDLYTIIAHPEFTSGKQDHGFTDTRVYMVAFPDGDNDATGENEGDFDSIMKELLSLELTGDLVTTG